MLEIKGRYKRGAFRLEANFRIECPWAVVFGPSGSGKSTLLRLIAGLLELDSGVILLNGRALADTERGVHIRPGHRGISMVTQQPALFPHLSVTENVGFGLRDLARGEKETRIDDMLELVQGQALRHRSARELSGGEAQRVALARALAIQPQLLLLDEPFSALDGKLRQTVICNLSAWLEKKKIPAISVTHDAAEAFQTNAEVLVFQEGKMIAQGPSSIVLGKEKERLLSLLTTSHKPALLAK